MTQPNQYSGELQEDARRLAARDNGVKASELEALGYTNRQAFNALRKLVNTGELHVAKLSHRNVRYFADSALAAAVLSRTQISITPAKKTAARSAHASWGDAEAIEPPGVKKTVVNAPPPRFQVVDLPTAKPPCTSRAGSEDFRRHQRHGRF